MSHEVNDLNSFRKDLLLQLDSLRSLKLCVAQYEKRHYDTNNFQSELIERMSDILSSAQKQNYLGELLQNPLANNGKLIYEHIQELLTKDNLSAYLPFLTQLLFYYESHKAGYLEYYQRLLQDSTLDDILDRLSREIEPLKNNIQRQSMSLLNKNLYQAVSSGSVDQCKTLLDQGADPFAKITVLQGRKNTISTSLELAASQTFQSKLKTIVEHKKFDKNYWQEFKKTFSKSIVEKVDKILSAFSNALPQNKETKGNGTNFFSRLWNSSSSKIITVEPINSGNNQNNPVQPAGENRVASCSQEVIQNNLPVPPSSVVERSSNAADTILETPNLYPDLKKLYPQFPHLEENNVHQESYFKVHSSNVESESKRKENVSSSTESAGISLAVLPPIPPKTSAVVSDYEVDEDKLAQGLLGSTEKSEETTEGFYKNNFKELLQKLETREIEKNAKAEADKKYPNSSTEPSAHYEHQFFFLHQVANAKCQSTLNEKVEQLNLYYEKNKDKDQLHFQQKLEAKQMLNEFKLPSYDQKSSNEPSKSNDLISFEL